MFVFFQFCNSRFTERTESSAMFFATNSPENCLLLSHIGSIWPWARPGQCASTFLPTLSPTVGCCQSRPTSKPHFLTHVRCFCFKVADIWNPLQLDIFQLLTKVSNTQNKLKFNTELPQLQSTIPLEGSLHEPRIPEDLAKTLKYNKSTPISAQWMLAESRYLAKLFNC